MRNDSMVKVWLGNNRYQPAGMSWYGAERCTDENNPAEQTPGWASSTDRMGCTTVAGLLVR